MTDTATPRALKTAGHVFAWVLAAILLLATASAVWIGVRGALAYGHLSDAQAAAAGVKQAVEGGLEDPTAAERMIAGVARETRAARSLTDDPVWRAAEVVPWIGPQLSAVSTVAAAIDEVATSGLPPLAHVASTFSVDALRPQDGRIDLSGFVGVRDAAASGAAAITHASEAVQAIDRAPLLGPLRTAVDRVGQLLDETHTGTEALANASVLIPAMLGADGPRNYLLLFQNDAEWRSLGGNPGAMALIHTEGGTMSLVAQDSTAGFPRYKDSVLPLGPEVEAIFGQRPGRWMQNTTLVPDFAVAGALTREMWAREHDGQQVDGVIAIDPVALSYLLGATGPVTLSSGEVLNADNAVSLLLNDVYLRYASPSDQNAFFATATAAVFDAVAHGDAEPSALVAALTRAGDEHRLLLWSAHPDDQSVLTGTTLAGGLPVTDADASTFGVYLNDGTGSKMDYYMSADTTVAWDSCALDTTGAAVGTATLTLTLTNNAAADAASLPSYITGGGDYGVPPGSVRTTGYVYLPEGFELVDSAITGDVGFGGGFHSGRQVMSFTVVTAPGASAVVTLTVHTPGPSSAKLAALSTPTVNAPVTQPVAAFCEGP